MGIGSTTGPTAAVICETAAKSSRLNKTTNGAASVLGSQSGADTDEVIVPNDIATNNEGDLEASPSYVGRHFLLRPLTQVSLGGGIAASAVLVAGGSGYDEGVQTLTVSGGTGRNSATVQVLVESGVVTVVGDIQAHGDYVTVPSNPVATTGGGGVGCTLTITYSDGEEIRFVTADASNTLTVHEDWVNIPVSGEDWAVCYILEDCATVTGCTLVTQSNIFTFSKRFEVGDKSAVGNLGFFGVAEGRAFELDDISSGNLWAFRCVDGGYFASGYLSGGAPINGGYVIGVNDGAGENVATFDDGCRFHAYDLQWRNAQANVAIDSAVDTGGDTVRVLQGSKFFDSTQDLELLDWTLIDAVIQSAIAGTNELIVNPTTSVDGLVIINTNGLDSVSGAGTQTLSLLGVTFAGNSRNIYVRADQTWKLINPRWTIIANPTNLAIVFATDDANWVEELFRLFLVVVDSAGSAIVSARIFVVETLLNDDIPYHIPTPVSGISAVDVLKRKWTFGGSETQATADLTAISATLINNDEGFTLRDSAASDVVFKFSVDEGTVTGQDETIAIRATRGVLSLATNAIGFGYSVTDTDLTLVGGTGTAATFDLSDVVVVDGQIHDDYDGLGNNGTFSGGTLHAASDIIDMDDGTNVTVDSVDGGGIILAFTVNAGGGPHSTDNDTIVQSATTGSGIDFDMTLGLNNQGVSDPITIATQGSYTVDPSSPAGHTGGTGSGADFAVTMDPIDAAGDVADNCDVAIDARSEWTGALSGSVVTITQDLGDPPDGNQTNAETVTNSGFILDDFTGGTWDYITEAVSGDFGLRVFKYDYVPFVADVGMFATLTASVSLTLDAALTAADAYTATKNGVGIVVSRHGIGETDPRPMKVLNYDAGTGGDPEVGETMTQGSATGKLVEFLMDDQQDAALSGTLVLEDWNGTEFTDDQIITGGTSTFSATTDLAGFYEEYTWLIDANSYATTVVYDYLAARLSAHVHPNCIQSDGGFFTDYTAEAKSTTVGDVQLMPATPATNDYFIFGDEESLPEKLVIDMSTGATTSTIDWEYWNGAWTGLSDVADETTNFTLTGEKAVTYTYPTDATQLVGVYYVRANQSHASPVGQPLATRVWEGRDFEAIHIWGTGKVNLPMITTPDGHKTERSVTRTEGVWIANWGTGFIDYLTADDGTQYVPLVLVTLSVHVIDETSTDLVGVRVAIYEDNDGVVGAELMNEDTTSGGLASAAYLWSADQTITIRVRESPNQASGRYVPAFRTGTITNQGFTLDVLLSIDAIASVT